MTRILVFRFSAMGDVVMLLPVLKGMLRSNSDVEIFLLTQKNFFPFFSDIERLNLIEVDLKAEHRSIKGLYLLFQKLRKSIQPDIVVDLHCVIRTTILDLFFKLSGYEVSRFNKGTFQKSKLVRTKMLFQLPNTVERYELAFKKLGFLFELSLPSLFRRNTVQRANAEIFSGRFVVGIAPFAKHRQKVWGVDKVDQLIALLNNSFSCNILLFGAGAEIDVLNKLSAKYSNCIVSANYFKLSEEIQVIQQLAVMVSMDSANMHIAAMAGIPTVSIWGATHPALGFAPYQQPEMNIIQYNGNELSCRPCSVYGGKKCQFGDDIRCMNYIAVKTVFNRICMILKQDQ